MIDNMKKETNWIKTKVELPPEGKYVIGRYNGTNWHDSTDQKNVNCVVVKLIKGLSKADRTKMITGELPDPIVEAGWCLSEGYTKCKRSVLFKSDDEQSNNKRPYYWHTFGPSSFNGQEIKEWTPIPK